MDDLYGLTLEAMPNRLVNYGVTTNGIAVIELTSDSAGAPLEGTNDRSPNTYTHGMMCDIDTAIVKARFDDDVTGHASYSQEMGLPSSLLAHPFRCSTA